MPHNVNPTPAPHRLPKHQANGYLTAMPFSYVGRSA